MRIIVAAYFVHTEHNPGARLQTGNKRDSHPAGLQVCQTDYDSLPWIAARLKKHADIVVLSLHWGNEYSSEPTEQQKRIARACIDSGATIIAGHHPHVIQPVERYHGGLILYSLGNFLFDSPPIETRKSMIVRCRIKGDRCIDSSEILPTIIENGQIYFSGVIR